jgi:hypothetical protein
VSTIQNPRRNGLSSPAHAAAASPPASVGGGHFLPPPGDAGEVHCGPQTCWVCGDPTTSAPLGDPVCPPCWRDALLGMAAADERLEERRRRERMADDPRRCPASSDRQPLACVAADDGACRWCGQEVTP